MARYRQTFRRLMPCNVLYERRIRFVDIDGRDVVRLVPVQADDWREIDWCGKDIFDYCRFFYVRSPEEVTSLQCKRCSMSISRRFGWRYLRNHLVHCVGTDFRQQFKKQKKESDEKTLTLHGKGLE